jgi:predicted DNA-binding transcriptional regulator AlpA
VTRPQAPAVAHLGRVADLLEEAVRELRIIAGSSEGDLDPLDEHEAECRPAEREPAPIEVPMMPKTETTRVHLLLTQAQLCGLLQLGPRTVRRLRNDPTAKFPKPVRRARALRWSRAEVEAWVEGRKR